MTCEQHTGIFLSFVFLVKTGFYISKQVFNRQIWKDYLFPPLKEISQRSVSERSKRFRQQFFDNDVQQNSSCWGCAKWIFYSFMFYCLLIHHKPHLSHVYHDIMNAIINCIDTLNFNVVAVLGVIDLWLILGITIILGFISKSYWPVLLAVLKFFMDLCRFMYNINKARNSNPNQNTDSLTPSLASSWTQQPSKKHLQQPSAPRKVWHWESKRDKSSKF